MISAGRVLIMPKGSFDPTKPYEMLDLVSYQGSSYVAIKATQGNLPTDSSYWQIMAYGASSANTAANFATLELTNISTNSYSVGDYLVNRDGELCTVIDAIEIGDQIITGTNVDKTRVDEMIKAVEAKIEDLAASVFSLAPRIALLETVDLNTLTAEGEYFKSLTTFFVTNAPLGIDSIPTAKFRIRVEKGTDSNKVYQSVRTDNGEVYHRAYNNSEWTLWKQSETKLTYSGTTDEWEALSQYEKALYTFVIFTDD